MVTTERAAVYPGVSLRASPRWQPLAGMVPVGALVRMGCVGQLRRSAAHVQSAWVLLARPTEELFAERVGATYRSPREPGRRAQHSLDLLASWSGHRPVRKSLPWFGRLVLGMAATCSSCLLPSRSGVSES